MKLKSLFLTGLLLGGLWPAGSALANPSGVTAIKKHEFIAEDKAWKATCDKAPDVKGLFCRIMTTDKYMAGKNPSFVHFGMAWSPESMGFVVASYMGFKKESQVTMGVDKHQRIQVPSSQTNTLSLGPVVAKPLLEQMLGGHKIVLYFYPKTGVRHLSLVDLAGFKSLHGKVRELMASAAKPQSSK